MNKQQYLSRLEKALSGLPADDLRERLAFYGESIDDRMEEGLSEEALLSVYIVLWSLILCLWAAELALAVSALGALAAGILSLFRGDSSNGLLAIGAGLALAGLSVFLFFGCKAASKGAVVLTGKIALWVKSLFLRKER